MQGPSCEKGYKMTSEGSNSDLEKLRGEMQRQIDHQIETARHYEKLAWNIFRTQTTLGGLLLSSLLVIATYAKVAAEIDELPNIPVPTYESVMEVLSSWANPFSQELGSLFLAILLILVPLIAMFGIIEFFCFPIWRAYHIQAPERLSSGADWTKFPFEVNFDEGFENNVIRIYSEALEHNETIVTEIKESWSSVFVHMVWGIAHFFTLIMIALFLIRNDPIMIIFAIMFSFFGLIYYIVDFLEMHDMREFITDLPYSIFSEIGIISLAAAMFFETATILDITPLIVILSTTICLISIVMVAVRLEYVKIFGIIKRNIGIFSFLFIFIGSYTVSMGILGITAPTLTSLLVGSLAASLLVYSIGLLGIGTSKKGLSTLQDLL